MAAPPVPPLWLTCPQEFTANLLAAVVYGCELRGKGGTRCLSAVGALWQLSVTAVVRHMLIDLGAVERALAILKTLSKVKP